MRLLGLALLAACAAAANPIWYNAAVVQTYPHGNATAPPASNIEANLDGFLPHVVAAAKQHAQIVVFPEAVIWNFGFVGPNPRDTMFQYGEDIPAVGTIACGDSTYDDLTQVQWASCAALQNKIVVVMNMVDIVNCTSNDTDCPSDGRYQFNTDVAFSETGALLAVYHKSHLFGTYPVLDEPAVPDVVTFKTSFGVTFGLFVCYDIQFSEPIRDLYNMGVRDIPYSTSWVNDPPTMTAQMMQQGWSRFYSSNLLAANNGINSMVSGGGIYSSGVPVVDYFDPKGTNVEKMLVAKVRSPPEPAHNADDVAIFQPLRATPATPANCTTWITQAGANPCLLFTADPGSAHALQISMGNVHCTLQLNFRNDTSGATPRRYAFEAVDRVIAFPGTPNPIHVTSCSVFICESSTDAETSANVTCAPIWTPGNEFDVLSLQGSVNSAFPLFAVKSAQVTSSEYLAFAGGAQASRIAVGAKLPRGNPLYSAALYGTMVDAEWEA